MDPGVIFIYFFNMSDKKRPRTEDAKVLERFLGHPLAASSEPQCLIISPSEEASVYFYTVAARLITPEVIQAVKKGTYGALFSAQEEQDEYWEKEKAKSPRCLHPLYGQIKALDIPEEEDGSTAHWGGAYAKGPWASFLAIYDWN